MHVTKALHNVHQLPDIKALHGIPATTDYI